MLYSHLTFLRYTVGTLNMKRHERLKSKWFEVEHGVRYAIRLSDHGRCRKIGFPYVKITRINTAGSMIKISMNH